MFKLSITTKSNHLFASKFLSTVLSDSIMLLEDALHRLKDIKALQEAIENQSQWMSQPEQRRIERESQYSAQETSAKVLLSLANSILDFLNKILSQVQDYFTNSKDLLQKLVTFLIYFFEKLCGPQMSALKVKDPKKYGFYPRELLAKISSITSCFVSSNQFIKAMASEMDYNPTTMSKVCQIVKQKEIITHTLLFEKLIMEVNQVRGQLGIYNVLQLPLLLPDLSLSSQETQRIEGNYKMNLAPFLFGGALMKREDGNYDHHYNENIKVNSSKNATGRVRIQRLVREYRMMSRTLPLSGKASAFVRVDNERIDVMKALLTGTQGTPYAYGVFVFDIFFPSDYPHNPPLVNLETNGHGTVRFNPNLYTDGKVCLSLLGTWHGDEHSKWKPFQSNLYQVLVSIQSLIMIEEPYYNEPSYEAQRNTREGDDASAAYNEQIQYNTMRWAMLDPLRNPPDGFVEVIHCHFMVLKDVIMEECQKWVKKAVYKEKMLNVLYQLYLELSRLDG
eukprot:TRINITY_DN6141_c0_g2_i1.p1 TRINITY_DN6141_c0_g2~~TRINITY_DN6141_c0_g2_i1.p1  ORF type:complete len:506 (-),score=96.21 TRINITY_DN6141_c0_g2_i1:223-1740(-)